MSPTRPRYSKEEFARRGDAVYEDSIRSLVEKRNEGKFVAIDVETGAFEIDEDDYAAVTRLRARQPAADIWLMRAGYPTTCRIGLAR